MRKTKIIGTIGPASKDYKTLKNLVHSGLNVVRINLSHSTKDDMQQIIDNVFKIRKELKVSLPILLDTRGPELRIGKFKTNTIKLIKGQEFVFTTQNIIGNNKIVTFNYPKFYETILPNQKMLADNGLIAFRVINVSKTEITCKVLNSGTLSNKKSISIPKIKYEVPYLNELDKQDIIWGIEHNVDFIAASFVSNANDVKQIKDLITKYNGTQKIISKIENSFGIKNLDQIIKISDGVMVARGDLGVEYPLSKLPALQKQIIKRTREQGKVVIIATEMLESMIHNNRPTRAEASDVANAVYDGTSAIMLSGETAIGKYPIETVKQMSKIAEETERHIHYKERFLSITPHLKDITDVISHSAVNASCLQNTKAIVAFTNSGTCAKMVSRFRPNTIILGATPNESVFEQLSLSWGVKPILTPIYNSTDEMFEIANNLVKENHIAKPNDTIIIICGTPKQEGKSNLIKLAIVE